MTQIEPMRPEPAARDGRRKKVFITGAAGVVGTALRQHLRDRYDFRLLFHTTIPEVTPGDEVVIGDVANFEAMLEATVGVDAIIHLALAPVRRGMTQAERAKNTIDVDIRGVYNIYEAARLNRVPVVVFASTNHVTGLNEQDGICSHPNAPVRPDSIYGAGKAFGEALGRLYADRKGVRVFCLRIANFNGKDEPGRYYEPGRSRWLSPRDLAQLVWRCIESDLTFGIFYGDSGGGEQKWDLTNARELLGYEPQDDGSAEHWRARYAKPADSSGEKPAGSSG
jgi:uronate dehydrogenase